MRSLLFLCCLAASAAELERAPVPPKSTQLLNIKRLYVDRLSGGETAASIRDMIINSLERLQLFTVTENPDGADATLRGSAEDLVYTDVYQQSESLDLRASANLPKRDSIGRRGSNFASFGLGQNENSGVQERKHEATAAIRLVDRRGDVIWTTTQESTGAKFRGASADVAEKVTKQLMADLDAARRQTGLK